MFHAAILSLLTIKGTTVNIHIDKSFHVLLVQIPQRVIEKSKGGHVFQAFKSKSWYHLRNMLFTLPPLSLFYFEFRWIKGSFNWSHFSKLIRCLFSSVIVHFHCPFFTVIFNAFPALPDRYEILTSFLPLKRFILVLLEALWN